MTDVLQVEGLDVSVGTVPVVRGVSFALRPGQRLGLIGESGSGKSLTALAVLGLLPEGVHARGSVELDGEQLLGAPERRLRRLRGDRVTMVFQEPMTALNPVMRVGRQVAEVLHMHREMSRGEAMGEAARLLERVQLPRPREMLRAYPHQLSGGQRQRVMLAIAIACRPAVLIADEPTTALDVTVQSHVLRLLDDLVRDAGTALLFITHDLAVVSTVCQDVAVMYGGRIVETGPLAEVFGHPRHPYTGGLLAASVATGQAPEGRPRRLPTIEGSVPPLGRFPSGCVFRNRCPRADEVCLQEPVLAGEPHLAACWHPTDDVSDPREVVAG